jgi:hypothetical protein
MKRMLLFLLLIPMAFAAWQGIAALAMGISFTILAVVYMVGFGFGVSQLQLMAKEELFQLIALGVLIVALVGADSLLNSISTSPAFAQGYPTMQEAAKGIIDETLVDIQVLFDNLAGYDKKISTEASKASQCNIMGMGYTVSGCGGYTILAAPLSMAGSITGFAIGELSAMKRLIDISETFALTLLLPVGILLRTLKITRGAGGLLIAFGVSLHIMLPAGIIFNEMLAATFMADPDASLDYQPSTTAVSIPGCNPGETTPFFGSATENELNAIEAFHNMKEEIRRQLYTVLIRATLGPVISLLMLAASIRALTSIAGAEVDVSAISRFI